MTMSIRRWLSIASLVFLTGLLHAASFYAARPEDPPAVYLTPARFPVRGDGGADDTAALKRAIARHRVLYFRTGVYGVSDTLRLRPVWPASRWVGLGPFRQDSTLRNPPHDISPDGTTFLPAGDDFTTGVVSGGIKPADLLRTFGLAPAVVGDRFYVSNEAGLQTWSFRVEPEGELADPRWFVEEGGEGLAVDAQGRLYLATGQIRVFGPAAEPLGRLEVPQRPTSLAFGGPGRKTLFVTARSALSRVRLR